MKRLLVPLFVCLAIAFNSIWIGAANALPIATSDWLTQLQKDVLPKLETIFTPAQLEKFERDVTDGVSFRKAFKSMTLTPEQKTQLKTVLGSISKKDALASLTSEQKKELFKPTSGEIIDKIEIKGVSLPEGVKEKIDAAMSAAGK